jgi:hypothetical protein
MSGPGRGYNNHHYEDHQSKRPRHEWQQGARGRSWQGGRGRGGPGYRDSHYDHHQPPPFDSNPAPVRGGRGFRPELARGRGREGFRAQYHRRDSDGGNNYPRGGLHGDGGQSQMRNIQNNTGHYTNRDPAPLSAAAAAGAHARQMSISLENAPIPHKKELKHAEPGLDCNCNNTNDATYKTQINMDVNDNNENNMDNNNKTTTTTEVPDPIL